MQPLKIEICDGKYSVVQNPNGSIKAFRYGEDWRDCTGDNLILSLMQEIEKLRSGKECGSVAVDYKDGGDTE